MSLETQVHKKNRKIKTVNKMRKKHSELEGRQKVDMLVT